jgi:hypothetical protein
MEIQGLSLVGSFASFAYTAFRDDNLLTNLAYLLRLIDKHGHTNPRTITQKKHWPLHKMSIPQHHIYDLYRFVQIQGEEQNCYEQHHRAMIIPAKTKITSQ